MNQTCLIQNTTLHKSFESGIGCNRPVKYYINWLKRLGLSLIIMLLLTSPIFGQPYKTGTGIRISQFPGFTIKNFFNSRNAVEGLLTANGAGFLSTGLYEFQEPTTNVEGLDWFIGGGAHMGFMNDNQNYWTLEGTASHNGTLQGVGGLDFIIGLEYTFDNEPFSIGIDFKPGVNVIGPNAFLFDLGLTFRYNFR